MKRLVLAIIATVMFGFVGSAQETQHTGKKRLISCIVTSCCGIGAFGIEIWSEKTCMYVSKVKNSTGEEFSHSLKFQSSESVTSLSIPEDVMLAGMYDDNGNNLILKSGKYKVENNEMFFNPVTSKAIRQHCLIREVDGNFMGHEYHYSISICISFRTANNGFITITPKLDKEQLNQLLQKENNEIEFKDEISLEKDGFNYTIKAGKYTVNEDGNIYIQNVQVEK